METETPTSQSRAWMPLVIRLITGGLLLYSGWLKLGDLNNFANTLDTMQLPVLSTNPALLVLFAESFPWFELGLGALLLSGLAARPAALVAGALFLTFTLLLVTAAPPRLQGRMRLPRPAALLPYRLAPCRTGRTGCRRMLPNGF